MDAAILVLISLLAITSLGNLPSALVNATTTMAVLSLVGLIGLFFAPHLKKQIEWGVGKVIVFKKIRELVLTFLERILLGMRTLQLPGKLVQFLAYSLVIWTLDTVIAIGVGAAFNISIPFSTAIIIIAALGLSSAIPSTPGYIGVYQFAAVAVMTPFGYQLADILVFIIAYQMIGYLGLGIWGGIGFWRLRWGKKTSTSNP